MIRIKDLSFAYGTRPVLDSIDLEIKKGLTSIVGPNAAGKSTLMKCIFGLLDYRGEIYIKDRLQGDYRKEDLNNILVYLPQEEGQTPRLTVLETVLLGRLKNLGWRVEEEELEEIWALLRMLSIDHLATRYLSQLSGGQRQLVYIAQTLARDPEILMMDEPTNNLDIQKQLELCQLLRLILRERDMGIVLVIHDLNLAINYSDHILVLNSQGQIYNYGRPEEVITEKMLEDVYGVRAQVDKDPQGRPVVVFKESVREVKLR